MRILEHAECISRDQQERVGCEGRVDLRDRREVKARLKPGMLLVQATGDNGVTGSSSTRLSRRPEQDLREEISHHLAQDIIELVGG